MALPEAGIADAAAQDAGLDAKVVVVADAAVTERDAKVAPEVDARVAPGPDLDASSSDGAVASTADASVDAGDARVVSAPDAEVDAATACPLVSGGIVYFFDGGTSSTQTTWSVSAAGVFQRDRVPRAAADAGAESCQVALAACGSVDVDGADLEAALTAPEVLSAFTTDQTVVFGRDTRAADGAVLIVQRADAKRIAIGDACTAGSADCTPIPAAVQTLSDLLFLLTFEQAAPGRACFSTRL